MIGLEQIADGSVTDRNFQKLMSLVIDTGGQSVGLRFGVASVTHTASVQGVQTVTHGLGRTPGAVLCTVNAGADGTAYTASAFNLAATTFGIVTTRAPAFSATLSVYWVAIG